MTDNIVIKEMTKDDLEDIMLEADIAAKLAGFESYEAMEIFKVNASCGLIKFGGSFAQPLGHALAHADVINTSKIMISFKKECEEHARLYLKWLDKRCE